MNKMRKSVVIFGAGISGLTVAHELLDKNYDVTLIEKSSVIGGFAKSARDSEGMPLEHSWRGYAPFYRNFFEISKRIPYNDSLTVYDQLSYPIEFLLPRDNVTSTDNMSPPTHLSDSIVLVYYMAKFMFSGKDREVEYSKQNFRNMVYDKLSQDGRDKYLSMLGPGLGLDQFDSSFVDIGKFIEMSIVNQHHTHTDESKKEWEHHEGEGWHVMKRPTNEAWFDPWIKHLQKRGLVLLMDTELVDVNIKNNKVKSCAVKNKDGTRNITSDCYVVAINPFIFADIVSKNTELQRDCNLLKCVKLVSNGPHVQIAFFIAFKNSIKFPKQVSVLTFPNSEFNITLYPQERLWSPDVYLGENNGEKIGGLWSGTVCSSIVPGKLFNLPAERCSKEQFISEVKHQIFRCKQLQAIIKKYNDGKTLEDFGTIGVTVWYDWKFGKSGEMVQNDDPKWVTTTNTYENRPSQGTMFTNLFLSGAHTKTSVKIWSMEGAVESGKLTVKRIGEKVSLHTHSKPAWIRPFNWVDDGLYKTCLPNVLYMVFIVVVCFFIFLVYLLAYLLIMLCKRLCKQDYERL